MIARIIAAALLLTACNDPCEDIPHPEWERRQVEDACGEMER